MPERSAGLLMYRRSDRGPEVFLVHPGGPFFLKKDMGAWTIPKGEYESNERPLEAARREFFEETGFSAPSGDYIELGSIRQKSGKEVVAWAAQGDCDPDQLKSNTCMIAWPPRSGKKLEIPEVDRGQWFSISDAYKYIREEQKEFLNTLTSQAK